MPVEMATMYIGNHIIDARYNYSLIQERIFNHIIFYCQQYIDQAKKGMPVLQLGLFNDMANDNEIKIPIKLNHIAKPDAYDHVRQSCKDMREVTVMTKTKDQYGHTWKQWDGLINRIEENTSSHRSNVLIATISKPVAEMLINIDRKNDGTPINYTTFKYEICMSSKNKYTSRIYKILSSWKKRLSKTMTFDELRQALELGNRYKDSEAIKRRILKPVMEELQQYGDIWYDIEDPEFEIKEGKKVVGYKFTILSTEQSLHYVKYKENIIYAFKVDFGFKPMHIKKIQYIIDNPRSWKSMDWRLNVIKDEMQKTKVRDVPAYIVASLLKHFKEG